MVAQSIDVPGDDYGRLVSNHMDVERLRESLISGRYSRSIVPLALEQILDKGEWTDRLDPETNHRYRLTPREFRRFITEAPPLGLGQNFEEMRTLYCTSAALVDKWNRAAVGKPGGANNPSGVNQHAEVKYDNVTLDLDGPSIIPLPSSRKPPTGNSTAYLLRQLERGKKVRGGEALAPRPDLLEQVIAGDLTPNAAALIAGFKDPTITLPLDPERATRLIVKHFDRDALHALIRGLANWAGIDLVEPQPPENAP